jgi:parallel beta-helix repeat protein
MKRGLFLLTLLACVGAVVASQVAGAGTARATGVTRYVNDDTTVPPKGDKKCATPNFATIQAAVDASFNGDTIKVCPGTYPEDVTVNKRLDIMGMSKPLKEKQCLDRVLFPATDDAVNSIVTGGGGTDIGFFVTADDVTIRNFVLDDTSRGVQINNLAVMDTQVKTNVFQDNTIGVELRGTDGKITDNCFRENNRAGAASGNGVYSDGAAAKTDIYTNIFWGHDSSGVNLNGDGAGSVDGIDITKNKSFDDSDFVSMAGVTGSTTKIENNNVVGTDGGSAFYFQADNHDVNLVGNSVTGSDDEAVNIDAGGGTRNDGFVIDNNKLTGNTTDGIGVRADSLQNSFIVGNTATGNGDDGLEISDDNDGIVVYNNNFKTNGGVFGAYDCFDGNAVRGENVWYKNKGSFQNQDGLCEGAATV